MQFRDPPAYQEFPASMLANFQFRLLPLRARGLLFTMRLECWVNRSLPAKPHDLAIVLGLPVDEVIESLPKVMPFFVANGEWLRSLELDNYRAHLEERKTRQSEGGKAGAAVTNGKKKNRKGRENASFTGNAPSRSTASAQVTRQAESGSLVQTSTAQRNTAQLTVENVSYLNLDGSDPLDSLLANQCSKCDGEGCGWCADKNRARS